MVIYVEDCCTFGTSKELMNDFVALLKRLDKKSKSKIQQRDHETDSTVEDSIEKFLRVEIRRKSTHETTASDLQDH